MVDQIEEPQPQLSITTYNRRVREIRRNVSLLLSNKDSTLLDGKEINSRLEAIDTAIVQLELLRMGLELDF